MSTSIKSQFLKKEGVPILDTGPWFSIQLSALCPTVEKHLALSSKNFELSKFLVGFSIMVTIAFITKFWQIVSSNVYVSLYSCCNEAEKCWKWLTALNVLFLAKYDRGVWPRYLRQIACIIIPPSSFERLRVDTLVINIVRLSNSLCGIMAC